jgi:YggT family protein
MFINVLAFLLNNLLGMLSAAFLLRFYLQVCKAPFHNPLSQAAVNFTNFAVVPLRRFIPGLFGLDLTTLLLGFLAQLLAQIGIKWLGGFPLPLADGIAWLGFLGLAALHVANISMDIFLYAIVAQALLSWVNPHTPIGPALEALSAPILNPIRRLIGTPGGIDLSPLVAILAAQVLQMIAFAPIEIALLKLL